MEIIKLEASIFGSNQVAPCNSTSAHTNPNRTRPISQRQGRRVYQGFILHQLQNFSPLSSFSYRFCSISLAGKFHCYRTVILRYTRFYLTSCFHFLSEAEYWEEIKNVILFGCRSWNSIPGFFYTYYWEGLRWHCRFREGHCVLLLPPKFHLDRFLFVMVCHSRILFS